MKNQKVVEFVQKVKELEREYGFKLASDDPFNGLLVLDMDSENMKAYELDGEVAEEPYEEDCEND